MHQTDRTLFIVSLVLNVVLFFLFVGTLFVGNVNNMQQESSISNQSQSTIVEETISYSEYTSEEDGIAFQYPSSLGSVEREEKITFTDGRTWSQLRLRNDDVSMTIDINPDGYGPFAISKWYTVTEKDGRLSIESEEEVDVSDSPIATSRVIFRTRSYTASNGNTYQITMGFDSDYKEKTALFEDIVESVSFPPSTSVFENEEISGRLTWDDIPTYEAINDPTNDTWQNNEWIADAEYTAKKIIGLDAEFPEILCMNQPECEFDDLNHRLPANSFVIYKNGTDIFKFPFNSLWGNDTLAFAPYDIIDGRDIIYKDVDESVKIGAPYSSGEGGYGWFRGTITMDVKKTVSFQEEFDLIEKSLSFFEDPQKSEINGNRVLRYTEHGLGEIHHVIVFGKDYVYTFSSPVSSFESMEDIIRTMK